jgi:hypothetical protein
MPIATELIIRIDDHPGILEKLCRALANHRVNIVALHAASDERRTQLHLVVDNLAEAKAVLGNKGLAYTETDVVQAALLHRPGELANAALRLGEAKINIKSVYAGIDPTTNSPLVFFGVPDATEVARILDQAARGALT